MSEKRKLSELIREGAKLRPQCTDGSFYSYDEHWGIVGSCALGAAWEAATGSTELSDVSAFYARMEDFVELLPDEQTFDRMTMRNDEGVSREQIADWLEAQGY